MARLAGIGFAGSQQAYTTSFGPVVPWTALKAELQNQGIDDTALPSEANIDGVAMQFGPLKFALYGDVDGRQVQIDVVTVNNNLAAKAGAAYDKVLTAMSVTPPTGHAFVALVSPAAGKLYAGDAYQPNPALEVGYSILSAAGAGIGAYHGYKRHNGSVGWALWWGFMGGLFPVITTALAFAQGISKPQRR